MQNVREIARNEIRHLTRSGALLVLAAIVASMLLASGFIGWRNHQQLNDQRDRYQTHVADAWRAQPDRHPHRVSHYGFLLFRPKPPLSFFDFGIESFTGTSLFLEPHRQNTANFSEARHATGMLRFGEMSTAQVLQLLVPLLIFFVAFSAVPRERELGTLPLLMAQGVRFGELVLGKAVGIFAAALLWTLPALAVTLAVLSFGTQWSWNSDLLTRVLLLALGYGAFLWVCTLGAVSVSALHRTSRGSLTTLITIWVALAVILPRALPTLGDSLYPTPSKAQFQAALETDLRATGDSHNPNDPYFQALKSRTLSTYGASELSELPVNYKGVVMVEAEKATTNVFRKHHGELIDTHNRQNRLLQAAAWLNPFLAIRELSMAVSGTDYEHHERFEAEAEAFRFELVQKLNTLHAEEVDYNKDVYGEPTDGPPSRQRISRAHFEGVPAFETTTPDLSLSLTPHRSAAFAVFGWTFFLTAGVLIAFRRTAI